MVLEKGNKSIIVTEFLYRKLQEAERVGIEIGYAVKLSHEHLTLEIRLMEIMEILFDYAMAKLDETELSGKKIYLKLKQKKEYVTMNLAFASGVLRIDDRIRMQSDEERNIALCRLKQLAEDNNGNILFNMKVIDDINFSCIKIILPYKV